jgi:monofunctional biosynthetic peptidoglycan transglycosylase
MARATKKTSPKAAKKAGPKRSLKRRIGRFVLRAVSVVFLVSVVLVVLGLFVNPPTTAYMYSEKQLLGAVKYEWVAMEGIAPVMARAAVAAEDANFCEHWGFDLAAIKLAIAEGSSRGASTISQQTVKNVYLWHGRTWVRKAMEALLTPLVEAVWTKRRVLEVYLNVAEFDEGVFGVKAAAQHYFGVSAAELSAQQASRLAAVLPSPKTRSASRPSAALQKRARQIRSGAATIRADGRSTCFES